MQRFESSLLQTAAPSSDKAHSRKSSVPQMKLGLFLLPSWQLQSRQCVVVPSPMLLHDARHRKRCHRRLLCYSAPRSAHHALLCQGRAVTHQKRPPRQAELLTHSRYRALHSLRIAELSRRALHQRQRAAQFARTTIGCGCKTRAVRVIIVWNERMGGARVGSDPIRMWCGDDSRVLK